MNSPSVPIPPAPPQYYAVRKFRFRRWHPRLPYVTASLIYMPTNQAVGEFVVAQTADWIAQIANEHPGALAHTTQVNQALKDAQKSEADLRATVAKKIEDLRSLFTSLPPEQQSNANQQLDSLLQSIKS